ncbi:hypothetical protein HYT25_03665 [Candidatus Pacearchaeota archaeon]|nr:hypothetical protein [Candidatus Pacearchaeota archaeon]
MNLESSLLNKSKRFARKTLIAGLTSSLIFLASCGGGGGSGGGSSGNGGENGGDGGGNGDSPEDESPQTYVLPAEEMDNISSVEDGRIVFFQPVDYLPGDLIVAPVGNNAPDGFLREITSTSDNKTFYTSQAKVEQVVPDGSFEFQETLSPSEAYLHSDKKGVSLSQSLSGGFDVNFDNVILFDADGNPYTTYDQVIANGTLHLDSNFYFQFSAASGHMTDLTFQNTSNESSSLEVIALASLNNLDEEINIGNIDFSPFVVWTPTFPSIPVVFRPNLELYVGLNGSISLIQASVNQEATSTFGVSYSDGSWSPINTFSNDFTFVPPNQPEISDMKASFGRVEWLFEF